MYMQLKLYLLVATALCVQLASGAHVDYLLGDYAGSLSGQLESHDLDVADHDHLGTLGEHLSEHSFPADYSSSDDGVEFAEAAASEHHENYDALQHLGEQPDEYEALEEVEVHGGHELDFDSKPVVGIDHGKGAYSYSTLYEFKDQDHQEHHLR